MEKFAKILSHIFDGSFISIPVYFIICFVVIKNPAGALGWALLCILFGMLIPYLYVFFLFKRKLINDLHVPNREDRIKPLIIAIISYIMGYFVLYLLKAPLFLKSVFTISIVSSVILTTITYFWKVSFHTSWVTSVAVTFYILFGEWALFLLLLIPVIGWARVKIKRHTVMQVVLGTVISAIISLFVYSHYGFIEIF